VAAGDEIRRRLERDLHDGAQQRIVIAAVTLRRAQALARGTPAEALVTQAMEHLGLALGELRDLARGIHPAVLTDRGLAAALEGLAARSPVPVDLRVSQERMSAAAEAAIYFTVAEALTNVAKHAHATAVRIHVDIQDSVLTAVVTDDGIGGADASCGSGLRGLADRLDALGGTLTIDSPPGGGTTIRASVPARPHDEAERHVGRHPSVGDDELVAG
jgi:signal transduction histidine kinase